MSADLSNTNAAGTQQSNLDGRNRTEIEQQSGTNQQSIGPTNPGFKDLEAQRAVPVSTEAYMVHGGTSAVPSSFSNNATPGVEYYCPTSHQQPVIYVVERQNPYYPYHTRRIEDDEGGSAACAICGFIFSWIPIVGLITYCLNFSAPRGSQRRFFATAALVVSLLVILFNIIFWAAV